MTEPLVCAIMLTCERPQMAARAVMSWLKQSYSPARRWLYVLDSGTGIGAIDALPDAFQDFNIRYHRTQAGRTIGALRNYAIEWNGDINPDIFINWDDDDVSNKDRIAEQVALLQSSGADVVGYKELLFWQEPGKYLRSVPDAQGESFEGYEVSDGQAWLYSGRNPAYAVGTSLCYWRRTWERIPFTDHPKPKDKTAEYHAWVHGAVKCVSVTSLCASGPVPDPEITMRDVVSPRLIASIHPGQNNPSYERLGAGLDFRRVPEWDNYCRRVMAL